MFELKESKEIELLNVNAQIYQHSQFDTKHIHLDSPNDEKVFMVAFRTIPEAVSYTHLTLPTKA